MTMAALGPAVSPRTAAASSSSAAVAMVADVVISSPQRPVVWHPVHSRRYELQRSCAVRVALGLTGSCRAAGARRSARGILVMRRHADSPAEEFAKNGPVRPLRRPRSATAVLERISRSSLTGPPRHTCQARCAQRAARSPSYPGNSTSSTGSGGGPVRCPPPVPDPVLS
jgi:hypothetical protein